MFYPHLLDLLTSLILKVEHLMLYLLTLIVTPQDTHAQLSTVQSILTFATSDLLN